LLAKNVNDDALLEQERAALQIFASNVAPAVAFLWIN
jgi:hypothetical protein